MAEERDERLVQRNAFGELMAMATENVVALAKIGADAGDLMVRNLRLAGRRDIARLGRQLARTEDKLESILQEVERLHDELRAERERSAPTNSAPRSRTEST
jgi:ribosome recycling factor